MFINKSSGGSSSMPIEIGHSGLSVTVEENVPADMRDGTILRSDVYRPSRPGNYPVLLCRTPYDKSAAGYVETAQELGSRGYIVVVQDLRGRYESDGEWPWHYEDKATISDGQDGYDTVEWAVGLPGSDGQVGTWGHSYPAWCIWSLAATQPPHLTAVFASGMSSRLLDMNFGVFETNRRLQFAYVMAADSRRRAGDASGPRTSEEADEQWYEVERGKWIWYLPLGDIPDHAFSTLTPALKRYLTEQNKEFWAFDKNYHRVNVATCQVTGWYDRLIGTVDNFAGMEKEGPESLRGQHRLIIGPWEHDSSNYTQHQGPLDFGPDANITYPDVISRWYDYQFKGIDNGIESEPPVKLFVMGENRWRFENEWPLARTRYTEFFLHSDGNANTVSGDGTISTSPPTSESPDEYDYDPRDPVMSLMDISAQSAPRDQGPLDGRTDILVYQTAQLQEDIEVTGPVTLKLWAASSAPDTDFCAKLIDVHPSGLAVNLSYGITRARYRNGYNNPSLIEPGKPYEYTIRINPTGILFTRGHRIRIDVSSSDFPNFDRNHNTGADYWLDAELRVAHQTVFHESKHPSRLVLPVIPR